MPVECKAGITTIKNSEIKKFFSGLRPDLARRLGELGSENVLQEAQNIMCSDVCRGGKECRAKKFNRKTVKNVILNYAAGIIEQAVGRDN